MSVRLNVWRYVGIGLCLRLASLAASCGGGGDDDPTSVPTDSGQSPTVSATETPTYTRFRDIPLHPALKAYTPPSQSSGLDPCTSVLFQTAKPNQEPLSGIVSKVLTRNTQCFEVTDGTADLETFYEEQLKNDGWTVQHMELRGLEGVALTATRKQGLESAAILVGRPKAALYAVIAVNPAE